MFLLQERGQDGIPGTHPQSEFIGCRLFVNNLFVQNYGLTGYWKNGVGDYLLDILNILKYSHAIHLKVYGKRVSFALDPNVCPVCQVIIAQCSVEC